jgi:RimJ/RimL family protein N-acetyltransferase
MTTAHITLEPLELPRDLAVVHGWVTHPKAVFWMMQDASREDVAEAYGWVQEQPDHDALLGRVDGQPAFLAETYDPATSEAAGLVGVPELRDGDLGVHLLVAPTDRPIPGFTRMVFRAAMRYAFTDPSVRRLVVEPDVRNDKIAVLNKESGFVVERVLQLPRKEAALSFCTREAFEESDR